MLFTEGKQAVINDITSVDDCPRSNRPMAASNAKGQELNILILRTFTLKYNLGANPNFIVRCLDELN